MFSLNWRKVVTLKVSWLCFSETIPRWHIHTCNSPHFASSFPDSLTRVMQHHGHFVFTKKNDKTYHSNSNDKTNTTQILFSSFAQFLLNRTMCLDISTQAHDRFRVFILTLLLHILRDIWIPDIYNWYKLIRSMWLNHAQGPISIYIVE